MTVDTCRPITNVYNCPPWQDLSTFLAVPCQVNQWLLCKTRPKEKVRSCKILVAEVVRESNLKGGMSSHWGQTRVLICQVGGSGKVPPPPIVLDLLYAPQFFTFCCQMWSDKRRGWAQEGKKMFGAVNCKLSQIWVEKFPPLNKNYIMLTFVGRAFGLTKKQMEFNLLALIHRQEWWKQVGNHFCITKIDLKVKQFSDPTSFLSQDTFHNEKGKQKFIICLRLSDKSLSEESENQLRR